MKVHTTNYQNTFIEIAEDCKLKSAEIPPIKVSGKTLANIQFEMISQHPYKFTSDDVLFHCYAIKNNIPQSQQAKAREDFFSKGQACFRTSPLCKRYGFGIHHNSEGKIALYACETEAYKKFTKDPALKVLKAMRSGKK